MGKTKRQRGGADSAWSYVYDTVGSGLTQFKNSLTIQPGENLGTVQSNNIEPRSNLNAQSMVGVPTAKDLNLIQKGAGRRRNTGRRRKRRGGSFGAILNQAATPFLLLGAQQTFKRRGSKSRKSKSKSRRSKSRKSRR
jgi:hypothetical protein